MAAFDILPLQEYETLKGANNDWPLGVTVDETYLYVSDQEDVKVYAYNRVSRALDPNREFGKTTLVAAGNAMPSGIATDNQTMYIADQAADPAIIFAYDHQSTLRDSGKDIPVPEISGSTNIGGMVVIGNILYAVYVDISRVVAFNTTTKERVTALDITKEDLPEPDIDIWGVWGTNTVLWVSSTTTKNIYAYERVDKTRRTELDFTVTEHRLRNADIHAQTWRYVAESSYITAEQAAAFLAVYNAARPEFRPTILANAATGWNNISFVRKLAADYLRQVGLYVDDISGFTPAGIACNNGRLYPLDERAFVPAVNAYEGGGNFVRRYGEGSVEEGYLIPGPGFGPIDEDSIQHSAFDTTGIAPDSLRALDITNDGRQIYVLLSGQQTNTGNTVYCIQTKPDPLPAFSYRGLFHGATSWTRMAEIFPNRTLTGICWDGESLLLADNSTKEIVAITNGVEDSTKAIARPVIVDSPGQTAINIVALEYDGESLLVLDNQGRNSRVGVYGFIRTGGTTQRDRLKDITHETLRGTNPTMDPQGVGFDVDRVYVIDKDTDIAYAYKSTSNASLVLQDFTLNQTLLQTAASDIEPAGVAIDDDGDALVLDGENKDIKAFSFTKNRQASRVTARDITVTQIRGSDYTTPVNIGQIGYETGTSRYYVADTGNTSILCMTRGTGATANEYTRTTTRDLSETLLRSVLVPYGVQADETVDIAGIAWEPATLPAQPALWVLLSTVRARVLSGFRYNTTTNTWSAVAGKRFQVTSSLSPRGLLYNPGTSRLYVGDSTIASIIAYQTNGLRDVDKDIEFESIGSVDPAFTIGAITLVPITGGNNRILVLNTNISTASVLAFDAQTGVLDPQYYIRHDVLLEATSEIWALGLAYDGTNVLLTDQRSDNVYAFTYSDRTVATRVTAKDVPATVLASANANIVPTGIVWDGAHYRVSDSNANKVYAFTTTAKVDSKELQLQAGTDRALLGLGFDKATERIYVLRANRSVIVFDKDNNLQVPYNMTSAEAASITPGVVPVDVAYHNGTLYLLDATEDIAYALDQDSTTGDYTYNATKNISKGVLRGISEDITPTGIASIFPVSGLENGILAVCTEDGEVYGITPPSRADESTRYVEIANPRGIVAERLPGNTTTRAMYVVGSGEQDKVFALEMPQIPQAPLWDVPRAASVTIVTTQSANITIPRALGNPAATYTATGLPVGAAVNGISFDPNTRTITGFAASTEAGKFGTVVVTARNAYGSAKYRLPWIVGTETAARFASSTITIGPFVQGSHINYQLPAVTAGFPLPDYQIVDTAIPGTVFDNTSRKLSGIATNVGAASFTLRATNVVGGTLREADLTVNYSVTAPTGILQAPEWLNKQNRILSQRWSRGNQIQDIIIPPVDAGNPPPAYSLITTIPGISFDPNTRTISGAATGSETAGSIQILAANSVGSDILTINYELGESTTPAAPLFNQESAEVTFNVGSNVRYQLPRVGEGYPTPVYTIDEVSTGLAFDADTLLITGSPRFVQSVQYTLTATNPTGSATFTLFVNIAIAPPNFGVDSLPALSLVEGRAINPYTLPGA